MNSQLLRERQDFGFPPYSRIIEITIKDTYADRAERMAQLLTDMLKEFDINGPYSPPVDRIAEQHIRKLRISLKKDRQLTSKKDSLKAILNSFEKSHKYEGHVTVDVDPL